MLASLIAVVVLWLVGELVLYIVHWHRHRNATVIPRRQEDRILYSCLALAFGMLVAVVVRLRLEFY